MWPFSNVQVSILRRDVTQLKEDVAQLTASYERLRGRLYATGQHKAPLEAQEPVLSKGEILKAAGFVPGRPMRHT